MEEFISLLEGNRFPRMRNGKEEEGKFADWTLRDMKVCLRKFYKWLLGDGERFPKIVDWIDTHIEKKAPPSLALGEIRKCVEGTHRARWS